MDYDSFAKAAMERYMALPQETSELYKRHYISVPGDDGEPAAGRPGPGAYGGREAEDATVTFGLGAPDGARPKDMPEFVKVYAPAGMSAERMGVKLHDNGSDKYAAYVHAFTDKVVDICVPDGASSHINIILKNATAHLNVQVLVRLGRDSRLDLYELCQSGTAGKSVLGVMHEALQEPRSKLSINCVRDEGAEATALSFLANRSGEGSSLKYTTFYNGAAVTRARNRVCADRQSSSVEVNEMVFGSASQKFDIMTSVSNSAPDTSAVLESRAALTGGAVGMLKGFAKLHAGARRARSYIYERGIMLDAGSKAFCMPDMSVDESDVRASHSAATAPVDGDALFYMATRGIDETEAKREMVAGFFANGIAKTSSIEMREMCMALINGKLGSYAREAARAGIGAGGIGAGTAGPARQRQ